MKMIRLFFALVSISIFFISCQKSDEKKESVAILKFTSHPALDEFENAFITQLEKNLKANNFTIKIEKYNANRDVVQAKQIAEMINRKEVKLIIAIATPAAEAILRTPTNIPVLYGAVANPKGAGLIPSQRFTGIKNAGPEIIKKAITFLKNSLSKVNKIGTIYNPAEQNSVYVQNILKEICDQLKIKLVQRTITDPSYISSMTLDLLNQNVDLIYSANDNMINSSIATVVSICKEKKVPFVIGDLSTITSGAVLAVGLKYDEMGINLANIAIEILKGKSIKDFPPEEAPEAKIWLNYRLMKQINLSIRDSNYFYSNIEKTLNK